jgi:dolichol-phosphate mannosyltransferase
MRGVKHTSRQIIKIPGPIAIFGAGGFVGFNLLWELLGYRKDVFGIFSEPRKNWRIQKKAPPPPNVVKCNILEKRSLHEFITTYKPKTIFNLAAYGAYSTQTDIDKIYQTNFNSTYEIIEELKKYGFSAYIHAGSQSEYGLNSSGPSEQDELIPNSHYAVSKTADYYLLKYYGKIEKLPVAHLRLYSVYGPWEEPNRLIPTLINEAKKGKLPPFVDPHISRDFVYVDDVVEAIIMVVASLGSSMSSRTRFGISNNKKQMLNQVQHDRLFGEAFNICTGKKTTMKELAYVAKNLFKIKDEPQFGSMKNRDWDLKDWYGNPTKIQKVFGWKTKISLKEGLRKIFLKY